MTRYLTRDCDCPDVVTGTGGKRPDFCEPHRERFYTEKEAERSVGVGADPRQRSSLTARSAPDNRRVGVDSSTPQKPRRRKGPKRSEPKRDWTLARAKVEEENFCCRVCGAPGAEAAHILGRKFDQPISPGAKTLLVLPDRIVPLCNEEMGSGCHVAYDTHILDLLPYLTAAEQAQAVLDAGSMGLALKRISPMLEMAA